ncbi:MAG: proline--tRNA ligase, partial [Spirochaetia bacterium]|nr:proline--tRNA ligase [Spirochaetia bacterium]
APFEFVLVSITRTPEDEAKVKAVYDAAVRAGLEVLWDDRDLRPGVKFADAELIGYPVRITAGKTFLEKGALEVQVRKTGEQVEVSGSPAEIVTSLETLRSRLAAEVADYTKE